VSVRAAAAVVAAIGVLVSAGAAGAAAADAEKGRALAEAHCSRCHVVGTYNAFGGANNTASFQMIIRMSDGLERFQTFYARPPHPVFIRIPGIAAWSNAPANAAEISLTLDQVNDIATFARTLEKVPIRRKSNQPRHP